MAQLGPVELASWRADSLRPAPVIVDVREPWEVEFCRIEGAVSIPLGQIPTRHGELPADRDLVLVCHHGGRSQQAAMWLERNGRAGVHNLRGGVEAWSLEVDPAMPRY
ncbi:MAG: rhodanese-like domain-containing protein [Betaproteobacteria bacterium]